MGLNPTNLGNGHDDLTIGHAGACQMNLGPILLAAHLFTPNIMTIKILRQFRTSEKDPAKHLESFYSEMPYLGATLGIMCHAFP